ncbi:abortive infection family protein [Aliivibrio wodanis]|uniref:abortive infection family protein n=1 Tax=Aliivibrio wodanis TaxID=80852 RepID=UPI00406BE29D
MKNIIPNSVIGAVSSVIAKHYYSHSKIESLFMEFGAPGDVPEGNCEKKCAAWLRRCNDDPAVDGFIVLGGVIQAYMDAEVTSRSLFANEVDELKEGKARIISSLEKNQLTYQTNGYIVKSGSTVITKTLEQYLKAGDFSSVEKEFERALRNINTDPHASVTAASSIIEAVLKYYIETRSLEMPRKMNIAPLWKTVRQDLALNSDVQLSDDQNKILTGITSIIDGVGAFRSHIGSAHGRGISPPQISVSEARLAVNVAHSVVTFIMEKMGE